MTDLTSTCKHCGLAITGDGRGNWRHAEGLQRNMNRCALTPYGYNACPEDEACDFTCNGAKEVSR